MHKELNCQSLTITDKLAWSCFLFFFFSCSYLALLCGHKYSHAGEFLPALGMMVSYCSGFPNTGLIINVSKVLDVFRL